MTTIEGKSGFTIRPRGGLGNQLFIYAAGRHLSLKHQVPLFIDPIWFYGQSKRKFELEPLISDEKGIYLSSSNAALKSLVKNFGTKALALEERALLKMKQRARGINYEPIGHQHEVYPGDTLVGYFQSPTYFSGSAETLEQEFVEAFNKVGFVPSSNGRSSRTVPHIAVHFRRGDYLNRKEIKYHGVLGRQYYASALSWLSEVVGDFVVVPFSDDMDFAIKVLRDLHPQVNVISTENEPTAWSDLALMSSFDGVVTANSSFSWWAAWMVKQDGKLCVAPDPWYGPNGPSINHLVPSTWKVIPQSRS